MLLLHISAGSGVPVYLQLEQQIKQSISSGLLQAGDALSSIRRTAADLRINPNTVARAFQNLEREGVIRTVVGGGTFVGETAAAGHGLLKSEKLRRLRPIAEQLAVEAAQLGVARDQVEGLVREVLDAFQPSSDLGRKQKKKAPISSRAASEKSS